MASVDLMMLSYVNTVAAIRFETGAAPIVVIDITGVCHRLGHHQPAPTAFDAPLTPHCYL